MGRLLLRLRHSVNRMEIEYPAVRILGPQSFGLGVSVGMGGQIIDGAIELFYKELRQAAQAALSLVREVDGFKFCYKICDDCGHAVRYYYPAVEGTPAAVKEYRQWKKYLVQ